MTDFVNVYLLLMTEFNEKFDINAYFTAVDLLDVYHCVPEQNLRKFQIIHDISKTLTRAYFASIYGQDDLPKHGLVEMTEEKWQTLLKK